MGEYARGTVDYGCHQRVMPRYDHDMKRFLALLLLGYSAATLAGAAPITQRSVELERAQISYRERGQGRPVVFVHALLLDSRLWLDQLDGVCDTRRCLAPDLSGHGYSSPSTQTKIDMQRYADELVAFLDATKVREADFVGLSAGGNIAAIVCARQPQRCRSLTLISTVLGSANLDAAGIRYRAENARTVVIEGKDTLFRRFNEYIVAPEAPLIARARYKTMLGQTPYETLVAFLTTSDTPSTADLPPKLTMPVMIPVGQGDTVLTPAMARKIAATFPSGRVIELASAGRLLPLEAPTQLNDALQKFWLELDNGGKKP